MRGPVELSFVAEVILPSVKVGPEDLYKQTAAKEMHERININSERFKHSGSEAACLISQGELKQQIARRRRTAKNCAAFLRHALRRHFSIVYLNPTPIAELAADTAAELKTKAGDSIGLTNLGKVPTGITPGFGMFEGGSESPDEAIE